MYKLTHIYKSFADKQVLSDINLTLHNEVVALIGENGAGKTTLLKILLGEIEPDDGRVQQNGAVGYIPQHPNFGKTIADCFDVTIEQWRIAIALEDVGLSKPMDFLTSKLSGGQKTRLAIATVLAQDPTPEVLLLDEPTNNLDTEALRWLEMYVKSFQGAAVLVSHDRSFINASCSKVIELNGGKLTVYSGNYDDFKAQKELEYAHAQVEYEANIEERERLQKLLKSKTRQMQTTSKQRYDRRMGIPKITFNASKNASQANTGRQMKALNSRIEQLGNIEKPDQAKDYRIDLSGGAHYGKLILRLKEIQVPYLPQVSSFELEMRGSERIRLSGVNGSGKSTILKVAQGMIVPAFGTVVYGESISIGYLSQDVDGLNTELTALQNLEQTEAHKTDIYREARSLGLKPDELKKKPSELSRGQQTKLSFAKLLLARHDLLILDEPTNHLDIPTRESIERALQNYQGAILLASHDEYFARSVGVTKEIELDNGENHEK